jgi:hypothetical protein
VLAGGGGGEGEVTKDDQENISDKCLTCKCSSDRGPRGLSINGHAGTVWYDHDSDDVEWAVGDRVVKFMVGDTISMKAMADTIHGVSLRLDGLSSHTSIEPSVGLAGLAQAQADVMEEMVDKIAVLNPENMEAHRAVFEGGLLDYHGGVPLTFKQQSNPSGPSTTEGGVVIAEFRIKEGARGSTGTVACTAHGVGMSYWFKVCG